MAINNNPKTKQKENNPRNNSKFKKKMVSLFKKVSPLVASAVIGLTACDTPSASLNGELDARASDRIVELDSSRDAGLDVKTVDGSNLDGNVEDVDSGLTDADVDAYVPVCSPTPVHNADFSLAEDNLNTGVYFSGWNYGLTFEIVGMTDLYAVYGEEPSLPHYEYTIRVICGENEYTMEHFSKDSPLSTSFLNGIVFKNHCSALIYSTGVLHRQHTPTCCSSGS